MQRRQFSAAVMAGAAQFAFPSVRASAYPDRPVKIIVSLPPGSGADTTARFLAGHLRNHFGQPFVVENRPGANSFIAAKAVADAAPDGLTLFVASNTPMVTNAAAFKQLPYDPVKDFTAVAGIGRFPMIIVVPTASPYRSLDQLVGAMKASPSKLNFASGTISYQIAMAQFHELSRTTSVSVPYKGTGPAITDLVAGVCDFSIAEVSSVLPLIRGGKLRALAVAAGSRHRDLADVPTATELGHQGYEAYAWTAAFFPAKVPATTVERVSAAVRTILQSEQGAAFMQNLGGTVFDATPQQLAAFQISEIQATRRTVKSANIPVE